jgi:GTP-binding protein
VDISGVLFGRDPVAEASTVLAELKKYDASLFDKPRWLVLNKIDMLDAPERERHAQEISSAFEGQTFTISALTGEGCKKLAYAAMAHLEKNAHT